MASPSFAASPNSRRFQDINHSDIAAIFEDVFGQVLKLIAEFDGEYPQVGAVDDAALTTLRDNVLNVVSCYAMGIIHEMDSIINVPDRDAIKDLANSLIKVAKNIEDIGDAYGTLIKRNFPDSICHHLMKKNAHDDVRSVADFLLNYIKKKPGKLSNIAVNSTTPVCMLLAEDLFGKKFPFNIETHENEFVNKMAQFVLRILQIVEPGITTGMVSTAFRKAFDEKSPHYIERHRLLKRNEY